jgi:hypothetical protein
MGVFFNFALKSGLQVYQLFKSNITFCVFLIIMQFEKSVTPVDGQLFKSNLTFCVVCVFNLQFEKSVFLGRVVHSQSTIHRQKNTLLTPCSYATPVTGSQSWLHNLLSNLTFSENVFFIQKN